MLERLRDETGESVQLFVRSGRSADVRGVARVAPRAALDRARRRGPAPRSGLGRPRPVRLLAHAPALVGWRFAGDSPADVGRERRGARGGGGVGAVRRSATAGHVVAAVSVSGPVERLTRAPARRYGDQVAAAAARHRGGRGLRRPNLNRSEVTTPRSGATWRSPSDPAVVEHTSRACTSSRRTSSSTSPAPSRTSSTAPARWTTPARLYVLDVPDVADPADLVAGAHPWLRLGRGQPVPPARDRRASSHGRVAVGLVTHGWAFPPERPALLVRPAEPAPRPPASPYCHRRRPRRRPLLGHPAAAPG